MKNINIVNKMAASNLKIDLKTVESINKIYWKEIVKNLTTVSEHPVHIKKIGTIGASPRKTKKYIQFLLNKIKKVKESTKYTDNTKERVVNGIKEQLTLLLKKRNQHATQFYKEDEQDRKKKQNQ